MLKVGKLVDSSFFDVVDFEASSLSPISYPIEAGWTVGPDIHSSLIRPVASWVEWNDYAESHIHHISRQQLQDEGKPPSEVLQMMNDTIGSRIMWVDGGSYDQWWLQQLESAAGFKASFRLGDIFYMLDAHYGITSERFVMNKQRLTSAEQLHRAGYDARLIKDAIYAAIGYY